MLPPRPVSGQAIAGLRLSRGPKPVLFNLKPGNRTRHRANCDLGLAESGNPSANCTCKEFFSTREEVFFERKDKGFALAMS